MKNSIGKIKNKYYGIALDFVINIFASGVVTVVLQLLVYPFFAREFDASMYGILLTIMGVENTMISAFGNSLNNVRLVQNDKYDIKQNGDFNRLLLGACIISSLIEIMIFYVIFHQSVFLVFCLIINAILGILRFYYSVIFRLLLDFKKMFICNSLISAGYFAGVVFFKMGLPWPIIFITGEIFGITYLANHCILINQDFSTTRHFSSTAKKYRDFVGSSIIGSALTYLDRLLILPVLGAESVSLYSVSTVFGKMLGIIMLPIAGVMLGYFSQRDFKINKKIFSKIIMSSFGVCLIFYVIALLAGRYFTAFLYPSLVNHAIPYMAMANLTAITAIMGNMISPIVVRYVASPWQIFITGSYAVIYMAGAYYLSALYGLHGFCIAASAANFYRIFIMYLLGFSRINQ